MFTSCLSKQTQIVELFKNCSTTEEKYNKIIELGQSSDRLDEGDKLPENKVQGCQSLMYLKSTFQNNKIYFTTDSDALISAGLAVLLTKVYSGEDPETILKCPPTHLQEIGIAEAISPNRANGLYSLHLKMKQEALKFLAALL